MIGRLWIQKRRLKKDPSNIQSSNTGETTLPNGFSDDISEIDADIDLTTPLPLPSVSRSDVSILLILLVKTKFLFSSRIIIFFFFCYSCNDFSNIFRMYVFGRPISNLFCLRIKYLLRTTKGSTSNRKLCTINNMN